jgi:hypothetical protein
VTEAGFPYITLSATNPTDPAGYANAHGELQYQYLASIAVTPESFFFLDNAYYDVITVHAVSHIHSAGLDTSASIVARADPSFVQTINGQINFAVRQRDGSSGAVYNSDKTYDFLAPGKYIGISTVNGQDYYDFVGTLQLYATVFGVTTTQQLISDGITPPGVPAGVPYTVTTNAFPSATGTLSIDSLIGVNPGFLDANGLSGGSTTLSPCVANASAPSGAPEPTAWALLIAGFGLTGSMLRRRRELLAC